MKRKAVCLLSGGMDSSTVAYFAKESGYEILALHFSYGQKTEEKERNCARMIAESLDAQDFLEIPLSYFSQIKGSSLTDPAMAVPAHGEENKDLPTTYVPFRNANLLAIATSYAEVQSADAIFIGVQASDYAGYPDCRPAFIEAFQKAMDLGTADTTNIKLVTPFLSFNKTDILQKGMELHVPYAMTWSCYQNSDRACGICSSCHYRMEAFAHLKISDPIPYEENSSR
ncbi:MAG: 7-cyano-7-deazaguanine synthase QueC [Methanospirillaceae archaeon]|nr:7-cyano-7-deazaguanine synthase QueC [Methanospirillaceae archaeon]